MSNKPIPGRTNSDGIFTAKNPHDLSNPPISFNPKEELKLMNLQQFEHERFNEDHPPLPCYDNSNNLVKDADVEVKLWWQINNRGDKWDICSEKRSITSNNKTMINGWWYKCRPIYLTVQPTENTIDKLRAIAKTDSKFVEKAQGRKYNRTPLTDAKPFEAVDALGKELKGAEERDSQFESEAKQLLFELSQDSFSAKHIPLDDGNFEDGYINGYIIGRRKTFFDYAQFATDAGGGKQPPLWYDEMSLTNYLQNQHYHKDIIAELVKEYAENLQQAFKKGWEKGYNDIQNNGTWDYVYYRPENTQSPSTHSSSEMVGVEPTKNK